jgi:ATP-binding cassette subfamily B protein
VTLVAGALLSARGLISVGVFVSFFAYVGKLFWPVRMLGRTLTEMGKAVVSVGRVADILKVASEYEVNGSTTLPAVKGRIEFDNVTFGYTDEKEILKGVSFTVEPGETVAILGKTGMGKSTLGALLTRLMELKDGSIRLDGVDIRSLDKAWLRKTIGLVLQESFLYSLSVRDNIHLGLPDLDEAELAKLAQESGLTDVVSDLEKGWDTVIGEQGITLSGGQRQRVALARMLARDPDILVLDDSMSALDTETDAKIQTALKKGKKRTCIIISHRLTTLAQADRIVVLEDGRIADMGTHEELIARPGLYRRIWDIQSGLERDFGLVEETAAV